MVFRKLLADPSCHLGVNDDSHFEQLASITAVIKVFNDALVDGKLFEREVTNA